MKFCCLKTFTTFAMLYILQSWANNQKLFSQDKREVHYGGTRGNDCTASTPSVKCIAHLRWASCFVAILIKMLYNKNLDYLLACEESLTDYQFLTLLQKGGMV
ncbi:hypothetical protein M2132_001805 [Dysgonomonas sp. PH5-45]|nr:hypothetical protein [Dysgonomonas sp. PH5-45]MDH6388358.1 hypothetical protein [Dysgonomonas sp. PH5-37]